MRIGVTGATGYIGGRLVPELLAAGHEVVCITRSPSKLDGVPWHDDVEVSVADAADADGTAVALAGVDAAYYLLHSMDGGAEFEARDRELAATFRDAAARAGVGQIVYLGGLGQDDGRLSTHLRSRHEVGRVLASGPVPVTELRAAVIIGSGSASFEMLRNLTEVLPVMVTPKWVRSRCQPIAIRDVLTCLTRAVEVPEARGRVLEIGGPDVLSYREMMQRYASLRGLKPRILLPVPILTPRLSSLWIGLVTPLPAGLARPLVESLSNEVIVRDDSARALLGYEAMSFDRAVGLALERMRDLEVITTWAGAGALAPVASSPGTPSPGTPSPGTPSPGTPSPGTPTAAHAMASDPEWSGGTILDDIQTLEVDAPAAAVFATVTGLGGATGWYAAPRLWELRGLLDRLVGGPGLRRGRRHPQDLRVGEPLDWWRVEAIVPGRLLRLRAEMRVPGAAWLEFTVDELPAGDGGCARTELVQRARFEPRGLPGRAYWYLLLPIHRAIFRSMATRIAAAATALPVAGLPGGPAQH